MTEIFSDGIDIDISKNIEIENISINSKNDCLDFMQTEAIIKILLFKNVVIKASLLVKIQIYKY